MLKMQLLLVLHTVKYKVEAKAEQRWFYSKLPARVAMGFTLAEVLITLLIIGVVSSLVIPGIMQDSQNAEYKVSYKKAFAVGFQIMKQCYSESLLESRSSDTNGAANGNNFDTFMNKFSVQKKCINNDNDECWDHTGEESGGYPNNNTHAFIDASGMAWSARCPSVNAACTSYFMIVDTNGFKSPNKYGRDRWLFMILDNYNQSTGIPIKLQIPNNTDFITSNAAACPSPPCYYKSWLMQ